jgi:hypothetical protein
VAGHIFQARPVWIYTQSDITNITISHSPEYTTPTQTKKMFPSLPRALFIPNANFRGLVTCPRQVKQSNITVSMLTETDYMNMY